MLRKFLKTIINIAGITTLLSVISIIGIWIFDVIYKRKNNYATTICDEHDDLDYFDEEDDLDIEDLDDNNENILYDATNNRYIHK